jgi:hypothetical protein
MVIHKYNAWKLEQKSLSFYLKNTHMDWNKYLFQIKQLFHNTAHHIKNIYM